MSLQRVNLQTSDGFALEAEWSAPEDAQAVAVLCHPHPQYGGTMRSLVISALFESLPARGVACLRFNFRGVENSAGAYTEGEHEPLDVVAAIDAAGVAATAAAIDGPVALIGWSFGADMALGVHDPRVTAWVAIAPPLRFRPVAAYDAVARDDRPKLLVLAAHDEFRAPAEIETETAAWNNTEIKIVGGASHFFVGRTDRVLALVGEFVSGLAPAR